MCRHLKMKKINPALSPKIINGTCYPLYWEVNFAFSSLCTKWLQAETTQKKKNGTCCKVSFSAQEHWYVTRGLLTETWIGRCNIFPVVSTIFPWIMMSDFFLFLLPALNTYLFSRIVWSLYLYLANVHSLTVLLVSQISSVSLSFSIKLKSTEQEDDWNKHKTRHIYYVPSGTVRNPVSVSFLLLFSETTWNISNKKEDLRHRPNSILACCATYCLGW